MIAVLSGALAVTLLALMVTAYEVWGLPRRRRRCLVNLHGEGDAIEGVLWTRRGPWLVLKDCRLVRAGGASTEPADGEILIEAKQVSFIQVF